MGLEDDVAGTVESTAPEGEILSSYAWGAPRCVAGASGLSSAWPISDRSAEGDDPLALCRELNEEGTLSKKALQDDLHQLSTAR